MTYREVAERLRSVGIDTFAADARILVSEFCGIAPEKIPLLGETELESEALSAAVERRCAREPLQYILGRWWFYGREFSVSESCLIPRPETELLVELATAALPEGGELLDLCTGSGCVGICVLLEREDAEAVLFDISPEAMEVAEENCRRHGVTDRCVTVIGDATRPPVGQVARRYSVITANPPYVSAEEMKTLEPELSYEPALALTDGGDGMSVVRGILQSWAPLLTEDGVLFMEIGSGEGQAALRAAEAAGLSAETVKDLSGLDRVLVCRPCTGNTIKETE